jgi:Na+/H+ antiporter NhaD/arsenite permease-like protein
VADGRDGLDVAGNLTLLGSIANLIVVQRAAAGVVVIGLWDFAGSACR